MTGAAAHQVLVTQANTAEGRAIAHALARDPGVRSVLCAHAPGEPLPRDAAGIEHVALDVTQNRDLRNLLFSERAGGLDVIVHAPPVTASQKAERSRSEHAVAKSVQSTQLLLRLAEEHPRMARFVLLSSADVYRVETDEPTLIDEDHPLELSQRAPAAIRERVEADLVACARMGVSRLSIAVLRCADILAPGSLGQLHDYLSSKVCLRPLGYDPMLNVLSLPDAANAVRLAALSHEPGVFNVQGLDSLPLSGLIHRAGRIGLPLPGPLLSPLYSLRAAATAFRFRYAPDRQRFHYGALLDGRKACRTLGYVPAHAVDFDAPRRAPANTARR